MRVARELVVFLKTTWRAITVQPSPGVANAGRRRFDELHLWLENNLSNEELTVAMLPNRRT